MFAFKLIFYDQANVVLSAIMIRAKVLYSIWIETEMIFDYMIYNVH